MTLSPEQIRGLCTSEVFDRAVDYREDDRIERIGRFGDTVSATVQGSQPDPYEVETEAISDDPAELEATCTCPYDWGRYCKHIIAVLLELSERGINLEDEREVVERVVSDAHPEELREFLLEECGRNTGLRRRLLTRFEEQDTQSIYDYKKEMSQQYRGPYTHQYEGPDFTEFHELAESHRTHGNPLEAVIIYRAMTEIRVENMDMVRDYYADDFDAELDAFVESLHEAELAHEDKREHIGYLFERWTNDDADVETFSGQYGDALWELCTEDADFRFWRTLIERELPSEVPERGGFDDETGTLKTTGRYEATRLLDTYADILDTLDDDETLRDLYAEYYLDVETFCLQYARVLLDEGNTDRAVEVAEEGLDAFSHTADIRRFLIDAYAKIDPDRRKALLRELFLQTGDWTHYEELRTCCSDEQWAEVVTTLEDEFEKSDPCRLIDLYLREGRTEEAFETVIEAVRDEPEDAFWRTAGDSGLTILSEYRADVSAYDPGTYFEVYKERLEPFLAETTGRKHYRTVIEYLEEMRELGFEAEFGVFVARLKEKHSNRPAFLDEIEALDVEGG